MTTATHAPAALPLTTTARAPRPPRRRRLARALGQLYADRPLMAGAHADDGAALPSRPYAELRSLR